MTASLIPNSLRTALKEGKVIPFVGAGVSMSVRHRETGNPLFPSWRELLRKAADRLDEETRVDYAKAVRALLELPQPDYLDIAEKARDGMGSAVWFNFLKEHIDQPREKADDASLDLARAVWGLGSRLIITTNYDRVMRWACPDKDDLTHWNIQAPVEMAHAIKRRVTHPTVWHLHGTIDDANGIILTGNGYKLLYPDNGASKGHYEAALATLRTFLTSYTLLFIGFSLDDEALGLQLRDIDRIFASSGGPHYALIREAQADRVNALKLPITIIAFRDFGEPLVEMVRALGAEAEGSKAPTSSVDIVEVAIVPGPRYDPRNPIFHVPYRPKGDQVIGRDSALQNCGIN